MMVVFFQLTTICLNIDGGMAIWQRVFLYSNVHLFCQGGFCKVPVESCNIIVYWEYYL